MRRRRTGGARRGPVEPEGVRPLLPPPPAAVNVVVTIIAGGGGKDDAGGRTGGGGRTDDAVLSSPMEGCRRRAEEDVFSLPVVAVSFLWTRVMRRRRERGGRRR